MPRPRSTATDVMIRLPHGTRKYAELFAAEEGTPLATWCSEIIRQYVRAHMAQFSNQQAAITLETMLETMEREFGQGASASGGIVAPPPADKNGHTPKRQRKEKVA